MAVDGSPFAYAVMLRAVQLTSLLKSDVTVLSVAGHGFGERNMIGGEEDRLASFYRELIHNCFPPNGLKVVSGAYSGSGAVYRSVASGTLIHSVIERGDPVERICAVAEKLKADLVIVGSRGLGNAATFVLGSVSEKVVHKCSRSVMVVKQGGSDPNSWKRLGEARRAREGLSLE